MEFLCSLNSTTAHQLDSAVVTFGTIVENALQETVKVGAGDSRRSVPRWKLPELLADTFQFPREDTTGFFRGLDGYQEVT